MRSLVGRFLKGRWIRSRHPAQEIVEFGVIIVCIAIAGIAGLTVLGRAEESYFIPLEKDLQQGGGGGGGSNPAHKTKTSLSCAPLTIAVGGTTHCSVTVRDDQQPFETPPQGSVQLRLDDRDTVPAITCALDVPTPTDRSSCSADLPWKATSTNPPNPHALVARYVPSDAHLTSDSTPVFVFVQPKLDVRIDPNNGCLVPWQPAAPSGTPPAWQLEIGHPIICTVTARFAVGATPVPDGTPVTWTTSATLGKPLFNCFQTSSPCPAQANVCLTVGGQCSIIFRQAQASAADALLLLNNRPFMLSAVAFPTAIPGENTATTLVQTIASGGHATGMSVKCTVVSSTGTVNVSSGTWSVPNPHTRPTVTSDNKIVIHGPAGALVRASLACTLVVFDADPTWAFDGPPTGCTSWAMPGDSCNPNHADGHPPFGGVSMLDSAGAVAASCPNATDALTSWGAARGYLGPLPPNETEFAASCQMLLNVSGTAGTTAPAFYHFVYSGEPAPPNLKPHLSADSATLGRFEVNFVSP